MLMSILEGGAVLTALLYLYYVARENSLCWYFAFISTALFTVVFFEAALSYSTALNAYYMLMAGYGYWQWRKTPPLPVHNGVRNTNSSTTDSADDSANANANEVGVQDLEKPTTLSIQQRPWWFHALVLLGGALSCYVVMWVQGSILSYVPVNAPIDVPAAVSAASVTAAVAAKMDMIALGDLIVTVFSIITTVMVAHKIYENWFYWMVINTLAAWVYFSTGLQLSGGLMLLYTGFAVYGWWQWRQILMTNTMDESCAATGVGRGIGQETGAGKGTGT